MVSPVKSILKAFRAAARATGIRISKLVAPSVHNQLQKAKDDVARLKKMVAIDQLTGAYNRAFMEVEWERLNSQCIRSEKNGHGGYTVLIFDIDKFKSINDNYGHLAGDCALVRLVTTIKSNLRAGDIFGRLGGDEFVILLPDCTTEENAKAVGERYRCAIEDANLDFTISVGCAVHEQGVLTREEMYVRADRALYQAKHEGRNNTCVYNPDMGNHAHSHPPRLSVVATPATPAAPAAPQLHAPRS